MGRLAIRLVDGGRGSKNCCKCTYMQAVDYRAELMAADNEGHVPVNLSVKAM